LFYSDVLPANIKTTHLTVLDENDQIISTIQHGKYIKLQIDAASITSGIIEVTFIRALDSSGKIEVTFIKGTTHYINISFPKSGH
jgi:hypothetical protein